MALSIHDPRPHNSADNKFTPGLASCVKIEKDEGGLDRDSVALCHQLRVLDKMRLSRKLGTVSPETIEKIEGCILFTLGITV